MIPNEARVRRTGGRVLADQLLAHGADCAFCVPGESYLELIDALYDRRDRFTLYNARHEAGAANMAEAYGKLTGRPGICMVTRGPGACHAAVGVHVARQDSTPMILLVGQIARAATEREAFQELDYRAVFGGLAKWATQIDDAARIPEVIARAFRVATSGRPGPVVVALPEDMLADAVEVADAPGYRPVRPGFDRARVEDIRGLMARAERPLLVVGGPGWTDSASADITRFAEANGLPTVCSFRRQDIVDSRSPVFAGDLGTAVAPALVARLAEADAILAIGTRLGDISTQGYAAFAIPRPGPTLIHVHADADEIGRVYSPDLGLAADPAEVAAALAGEVWGEAPRWAPWCDTLRAGYLADHDPVEELGELNMSVALAGIRDALPPDTIVVLDAGNHNGWAQRFLRYGRPGRQIGGTAGAMGYAVPAAVAASLLHPDRLVLGFVGDGGFMMSGMELATAAQHGAAPVILLFDNGSYGTIRMHQEREYPGRVHATRLVHADLAAVAAGLGAHVEVVRETAGFAAAFARARGAGRAAVIILRTHPEQVTSRTTVARLRAAATQG